MWFFPKDLIKQKTIIIDDIQGYVLPHASTKFTGNILSHTLRFRPKKFFDHIIILYYPANQTPNVNGIYYHEYYVVWKALEYVLRHFWNIKREITFKGYNIRKGEKVEERIRENNNSLVIVSADFSHFLPLHRALEEENCASHAILQRELNIDCTKIVDIIYSFEELYRIIPNNYMLQWIGRTRSPGVIGVGYESFLIRKSPNPEFKKPNGIFVTAYDKYMRQRECLGEWFSREKKWNKKVERKLINNVIHKGSTTSRLTGGKYLEIPITNFTVTYLYMDKINKFIRGWHGIRHNAFYLPDVFLENTFNNGKWINSADKEWPRDNKFNIAPTLSKLTKKAHHFSSISALTRKTKIEANNKKNYMLYSSSEYHKKINKGELHSP